MRGWNDDHMRKAGEVNYQLLSYVVIFLMAITLLILL